ncbi:MAG: guanylate kinase [Faecalibacterium sp.]|nr:guanylate kinase [Ruminococcus sp.]MCM1392233.1 guanylate kinase [Ruminococcus sp.]MCM1484936.1 guanylate kinase [Faecalibacterium sp.]
MDKGQLIVISGPSGCGKDTIIAKLLEKMGDDAFLSISMTTREMREGEVDGVHYYFVSTEQFEDNIKRGRMLEYAKYGSNYYGTPAEPIERLLAEGKIVFLNIEVQGGSSVRKLMPQAKQIFIMPPSIEELRRRLCKRGTETEEAIEKRMSIAEKEIEKACDYDFVVINDELDVAVDNVMAIINQ